MTASWNKWVWASLIAGVVGVIAIYVRQTVTVPPLPVLHSAGAFQLTNQLGVAVTDGDLHGSLTVVNVIFSRCPTQCHRLSQQMGRLQSLVPPGTRLVSLTADPDYDSPEVLSLYGRKYKADPQRWWFLTGPKAAVYRYATSDLLFTVLESPDPAHAKLEDLFIHSADFAILDGQARLRAVVHGEDLDAESRVVALLERLRREH